MRNAAFPARLCYGCFSRFMSAIAAVFTRAAAKAPPARLAFRFLLPYARQSFQ